MLVKLRALTLVVVELRVVGLLPVRVLVREVDSHPEELLHDLLLVVAGRALEVLTPAGHGVPGPMRSQYLGDDISSPPIRGQY